MAAQAARLTMPARTGLNSIYFMQARTYRSPSIGVALYLPSHRMDPCAPMGMVEILNVAPAHRLQALGYAGSGNRRRQQVDMIGYEHIGMDRQLVALRRVLQVFQVNAIVLRVGKDGFAAVTALDDVLRLAFYEAAWRPCHGTVLVSTTYCLKVLSNR